ncbi:branched-chain amino acid ABC transporter permease [Rhizobium sp. LjRoot98]|uniref:branched-chain amino acid ABC transporter permease n=1 Tax=unclassified Rhizobium TaxID=2613769 RepID=UPI00071426AE|nr:MULTISPECIES: branched-chain amino acid ABC transporter permease [unclassified Rhizobium]KQV37152.1 branched-chain amino acid ABC transporter permease [Rhizobium sp. Root1204]KQY17163.1 branched-chain amino acid ABC transporter permease [Rhizobium sp. Root1334]KRC13060.1 branched-chain amino acid ABC transporter permease [Rhizobium sp. Root73]
MAYFLQQLASALPIAALYALLAFGYSIAFSVTRRADLTYGALFGFAGQMFLLFSDFAWNCLWLVLPAALAVGAVSALVYTLGAGLLIGRSVMHRLATTSANTVVVVSLGIALVLMELSRIAAQTRSLWLPPFLNTPVTLWSDPQFPVTLTVVQLLNTVLMLVLVGAGHLFLARSAWGRAWRAVSDDAGAAALCGIDGRRIFIAAYGLSSLLAAIAGILATAYYGTMDFGAGIVFGVKVLFIAAIGGQTAPVLAAVGAAAMGLSETLWSAYGPMLWRDFAIFSFLVLLLVLTRKEQFQP